jgi:hypothetical protein
MNHAFASEHNDVLYLPASTDIHGVTMRPQAMILWRGLDLLCCSRKYESNSPVTGAVYTVVDFTDKTVTVVLHKDYTPEGEPPEYVLTHKKAAAVLRLQFAICIAAIQGRTFRDTHVGLLDLEGLERIDDVHAGRVQPRVLDAIVDVHQAAGGKRDNMV